MEQILILFMLFGLLVGGLVVFAYLYKMAEVRKARTWLSTGGVVTKSQVRNRKRSDMDGKSTMESEPYVTYEYMVGSKQYHGSRISFAEKIGGADIQPTLKRYPVGATVTVYYNPADPQEAVLERVVPAVVKKGAGGLGGCILGAAVLVPLAVAALNRWLAPRLPNPDRSLFVILCAGMGLAVLVFAFALWRQARASQNWAAADGVVLSAQAEEYRDWVTSHERSYTRTMFRPLVIYMFFVDGQRYLSSRVRFGMEVSWSKAGLLRTALEKYPEESPVTVYYDPLNPSESVLERRPAGLPLMIGIALVLLVLSIVASGFFSPEAALVPILGML
jgi:hypothetical protein